MGPLVADQPCLRFDDTNKPVSLLPQIINSLAQQVVFAQQCVCCNLFNRVLLLLLRLFSLHHSGIQASQFGEVDNGLPVITNLLG